MIYVDADALSKLAHWNVLPDLPALLHCRWANLSTLSSIKHRALKAEEKPDGKLFHTTVAAQIAGQCIKNMSPNPAPDPQLLAVLEAIPQIDSGEALLVALAVQDPNGYFLTGDKRAMRAMVTCPVADQLTGKIICIEQVMRQCLKSKGRDWYLRNVCPHRVVDRALSMTLGSRCDANEENLFAGLDSYINELFLLRDPSILFKFEN